MKRLYAPCIALLLPLALTLSCANKKAPAIEIAGEHITLHGKVKRATVSHFIANGNEKVKDEYYIYLFDDEGKLTNELVEFPGNENMNTKTVYHYDEKGRLTNEATISDGAVRFYTVSHYGKHGKVKEEFYEGTETAFANEVTEYYYNDKGDLAVIVRYNALSGVTLETIRYAYDKKGNVTNERYFRDSETPVRRIAIACNDAGDPTNVKEYMGESADPATVFTYAYDKKGRLTNLANYYDGTPIWSESVTYAADGTIATRESVAISLPHQMAGQEGQESVIKTPTTNTHRIVYAYDEMKNRVSEKEYDIKDNGESKELIGEYTVTYEY